MGFDVSRGGGKRSRRLQRGECPKLDAPVHASARPCEPQHQAPCEGSTDGTLCPTQSDVQMSKLQPLPADIIPVAQHHHPFLGTFPQEISSTLLPGVQSSVSARAIHVSFRWRTTFQCIVDPVSEALWDNGQLETTYDERPCVAISEQRYDWTMCPRLPYTSHIIDSTAGRYLSIVPVTTVSTNWRANGASEPTARPHP